MSDKEKMGNPKPEELAKLWNMTGVTDKDVACANGYNLGSMFGSCYKGLVESGIDHDAALFVLCKWIEVAFKPAPFNDESQDESEEP